MSYSRMLEAQRRDREVQAGLRDDDGTDFPVAGFSYGRVAWEDPDGDEGEPHPPTISTFPVLRHVPPEGGTRARNQRQAMAAHVKVEEETREGLQRRVSANLVDLEAGLRDLLELRNRETVLVAGLADDGLAWGDVGGAYAEAATVRGEAGRLVEVCGV